MTLDPKPGARRTIVDPAAIRRATLRRRECCACGEPGANGHHVVERDDGGDDVAENIVTLCGSGTRGCHGAFHGSPYEAVVVRVGPGGSTFEEIERRDREWVARRIGLHLVLARADAIGYVLSKLGRAAGRSYLLRRYYVEVGEATTVRRDTIAS